MVWSKSQYQLLDFGNGRKLERFGTLTLDRPCPAAVAAPRMPIESWGADFGWFEGWSGDASTDWSIEFDLSDTAPARPLTFRLRRTPFGHVGIFPEQADNWRWLYQQIQASPCAIMQCLNLFAYTGGSTLAMAAAGAHVVHVDASKPSIAWARENVQLSGLSDRPIRWIVDDALKFVQREIRRGRRYDLIVLDPPAYGHGPGGQPWILENRWQELLSNCLQVLRLDRPCSLLWTGHSPCPGPNDIARQLAQHGNWMVQSQRSGLLDVSGRALDSGYCVRAQRPSAGMKP
ncbi:MAG: class I SAM-dependent methyltransferase [Pirellulaceae bacterium]|nr:class I SAM-dependent methyltransferase [Pirellulaceae bacterium]